MNYFDVANSRLLYVLVGIGLLYISGLVVVFMRKAWRRALELGIPQKKRSWRLSNPLPCLP